MAGGVVLGRRLLAPQQASAKNDTKVDAKASEDAVLQRIQLDDRFFCDTMELIPAQFYFPTDEEENWRKSAPKPSSKKYHRDILAQKQQVSAKKGIKRAKFKPSEQKTNEERQLEAADEDKKEKQQQQQTLKPAKNPSSVSIDGLKERLAAKLAAMREQRKADEVNGKKRKANANAKNAEPATKKRKGAAAATNGAAFNNKAAANKNGKSDAVANGAKAETTAQTNGSTGGDVEVSASSISYGSLLLADEKKDEKKKTRNGQAVRGIKNLLKKAERNQQRMEELKKTDEGKALVEAKQWNKALKQAAGETVLDDPKLLRKKLKKKEKAKTKSSKEWKKRTAAVEISKKEKQKKRLENLANKGKTEPKDKKDKPSAPRAGFEGKKGEKFLNADKAKKK